MNLTQQQIGQRLMELRKGKGLSQKELARSIRISRPSMAQIELGNRNITILEFHKLSLILEFSLDAFFGENFVTGKPAEQKNLPQELAEYLPTQISFQPEKFKNVLLYILERCAGKPNAGETVLSKLLYFSDFNYYERYRESLTGAQYRKLAYGPVPQKLNSILTEMMEAKMVQRIKADYHGYPQRRFIPLQKADLTLLKASEKEVVDQVIEYMSDWSARAISEYSHQDVPWKASADGEDINYELALQREAPFTVRNYSTPSEET